MHRGPFFLSHVAGMAVNTITVAWLVFAIVFFSFPFYMPVTGMLEAVFSFCFSPSFCLFSYRVLLYISSCRKRYITYLLERALKPL
jgi:putative Mn2+ efflux pump MntP